VAESAGKVHIVGLGDDGVEGMTGQARRLVEDAEVLVGPDSCAGLLPASLRARLQAAGNLEELVERIEAAQGRRTVVLASGDPLFYGTARYVCAKLGKDRFEVVPHVSSMQLAFARVKESWEQACSRATSGPLPRLPALSSITAWIPFRPMCAKTSARRMNASLKEPSPTSRRNRSARST
jgi:precorrin-6Y C5,15-methyltransferase (decarboxylating)